MSADARSGGCPKAASAGVLRAARLHSFKEDNEPSSFSMGGMRPQSSTWSAA